MKTIVLSFFLTTIIFCNESHSQSFTLQQELYFTCKIWGFVKYYHSNVSTCNVNWDSVLISNLPAIESAANDSEFNDALDTMLAAAGPMALSTVYFPDTLPANLKRNRDWAWISSSILRRDVQIQLDTIKNNFRPHPECWMENNTYTTSYEGWLIFPYDSLGLNTTISYPDENHRILMLYKYWNILRYFNPYNYVLDTSWDTTLYNYAAPIANAVNAYSLYLLYLHIATSLNDTHVELLTSNFYYQGLPGDWLPYLRLKYVGGRYVAIKSMIPGIYPGDAIVSIDGFTTVEWEDSLKPYYSAGNNSAFRNTMCANMLGRQARGANETIVVQDSTGASHTISASCTYFSPSYTDSFFYSYYYPADSLAYIKWTTMPCDIGYVNMGNLQVADVNAMYADLQSKSAIIFDLRNYPNGTTWNIASLMYPTAMQYARDMEPDVTYPGTYFWYSDSEGVIGNPNPYTGQVIILMDEITLSQAEWSCMMLGAMPGAIKIGSQTEGADGNVTYWQATQDYQFGFTTLGVFYPNGDSTQRIGIVPDVVIYPTAHGIRSGNDELLDTALEIAGCALSTRNVKLPNPKIIIYPNPAQTELTIISTENISSISITSLVGQIIYANNYKTDRVYVNISDLPAGMYLIKINDRQIQKFVKE